jgi:CubicO group peptidase (beta-lactamase class C family)
VDGLDFVEHDPAGGRSDVVDMLAGAGKQDAAAYAEARTLAHSPGTRFNYSSGSSLVVAGIVGREIGGGPAGLESFLRRSLLDPVGIRSLKPVFDAAGTFLASSYAYCTARDFARFGLLYLRDGVWDDRRILPQGWVDHARRPTPASAGRYGAHWWLATDGSGIFSANGFRGQYIALDPTRDLVIVRLGSSSEEQRVHVVHSLKRIIACFPPAHV